jgi:hypothetical protein
MKASPGSPAGLNGSPSTIPADSGFRNPGVHAIRVSYFHGPRFHVALVLRVAGPGSHELRVFDTDDFKPPADAPW